MDKKTIARNFSRYAYAYDRYSDVQREAAFELLMLIKKGRFNRIMEVGCGTGNYTLLLREKFKKARIKAVDISDKMIEVASDKLRNKIEQLLESKFGIQHITLQFECNQCLEKGILGKHK